MAPSDSPLFLFFATQMNDKNANFIITYMYISINFGFGKGCVNNYKLVFIEEILPLAIQKDGLNDLQLGIEMFTL